MTHVNTTPAPPRIPSKSQSWPLPSTIITTVAPNQYFPQGPVNR